MINSTAEEERTMRQISREQLKSRLEAGGDLKLVFALGHWQYQKKHIPGSTILTCSAELYKSDDVLRGFSRDDEIVVYCSTTFSYTAIVSLAVRSQENFLALSNPAFANSLRISASSRRAAIEMAIASVS